MLTATSTEEKQQQQKMICSFVEVYKRYERIVSSLVGFYISFYTFAFNSYLLTSLKAFAEK